jgi:hypothetical protein
MVHAHADPSGVGREIVDAVGHRPAEFPDQEVMHPDLFGFALRPPFPAAVLEVANKLLLLRIDRDHRLAGCQRLGHAAIDMLELRVAIRMLVALARLAIGLQAEMASLEQLADHGMADPVTPLRQFRRQSAQALARPAQRRHRVAPLAGRHQQQEVVHQRCVRQHQRFAATTRTANAARVQPGRIGQLIKAPTDRARRDAGRARHSRDTPIPRGTRLARRKNTTAPLVQMRKQRFIPGTDRNWINHNDTLQSHAVTWESSRRTTATPIQLFSDEH